MSALSNAVFPAMRGVQIDVTRTVLAPPVTTRTTPSRREYRARWSTLPLYGYKLAFEFLRSGAAAELEQLVGFFNQRGGSFQSFRFIDPVDNACTAASFGVGNGVATSFQLARTMGGYTEPITELNGAPLVYVGGVLQTATYTLSAAGQVTFVTPPTGLLTWSGAYYRRVRFARDAAEFERFMAELWRHRSCELLMARESWEG